MLRGMHLIRSFDWVSNVQILNMLDTINSKVTEKLAQEPDLLKNEVEHPFDIRVRLVCITKFGQLPILRLCIKICIKK